MTKIDLRAELLKPHILPSGGMTSAHKLSQRLGKEGIRVQIMDVLGTLIAMEADGLVHHRQLMPGQVTRWGRT